MPPREHYSSLLMELMKNASINLPIRLFYLSIERFVQPISLILLPFSLPRFVKHRFHVYSTVYCGIIGYSLIMWKRISSTNYKSTFALTYPPAVEFLKLSLYKSKPERDGFFKKHCLVSLYIFFDDFVHILLTHILHLRQLYLGDSASSNMFQYNNEPHSFIACTHPSLTLPHLVSVGGENTQV